MKVALLFALAVAVVADQHQVIYVGYDHVLDYSPETGNIRAFDIRRHMPSNDTCDYFVYPPLIEKSSFVDVLTAATHASSLALTYLGDEMFMVQDGASDRYTIRRCSGFMPQQSKIPCEVWAVGHDPSFSVGNRYFYAGPNRVIHYHEGTQSFDILFYDRDVHGGGFPFGSHPIVSAQFSSFGEGAKINFAYAQLPGAVPVDILLAQDEISGLFKAWNYNAAAKSLEDLVGQLVITGYSLPGYRVQSLYENSVMAFNPENGDFEVWRFVVVDDKVQIEIQKRDNIDEGHSCIFGDRQSCIAHKTCGWCEDSVTCHQLNSSRLPCDGSTCLSIVDEYSTNEKKYQRYERPIPSALKYFGDKPADNPVSPLRGSTDAAIPISRSSDLQDEKIMHGYTTNPSEGIVYVPPRPAVVPCMDGEYTDPRDLPPPDVVGGENNMNQYQGVYLPPNPHSPSGDVHDQRDAGDCDDSAVMAVKNVTKRSFPAMNGTALPLSVDERLARVPENLFPNISDSRDYKPSDLGFAVEDDLMNSVRSSYSSLMPKGDDLVPHNPASTDPPAPPTAEQLATLEFKPREGAYRRQYNYPPSALIPSEMLAGGIPAFSSNQMETGVPAERPDNLGPDSHANYDQQSAMLNAQFKSVSINSPPLVNVQRVTLEHSNDETGTKEYHEDGQIAPREHEEIVEGWDLKSVKLEDVQTVKSIANKPLVAPEPENPTTPLKEEFDAKQAAEVKVAVAELKTIAKQQGAEVPATEDLVAPIAA